MLGKRAQARCLSPQRLRSRSIGRFTVGKRLPVTTGNGAFTRRGSVLTSCVAGGGRLTVVLKKGRVQLVALRGANGKVRYRADRRLTKARVRKLLALA